MGDGSDSLPCMCPAQQPSCAACSCSQDTIHMDMHCITCNKARSVILTGYCASAC